MVHLPPSLPTSPFPTGLLMASPGQQLLLCYSLLDAEATGEQRGKAEGPQGGLGLLESCALPTHLPPRSPALTHL